MHSDHKESIRTFCVQWTTINEWKEKESSWTKLESAVGAIDGVST